MLTINGNRLECKRLSESFFCLLLSCLLIVLPGSGFTQTKTKELTNKSIIDMKAAGLSKGLIIRQINEASSYKFDTDTESLGKLSKAGVEDDIINLMMDKMNESSVGGSSEVPATGTGPIVALRKSSSGIYYLAAKGLTEVEPTVYSGTKKSGDFLGPLTNGIAKKTVRKTLNSPEANLSVTEKKPVFYFVFTSADKNLNNQATGWLTGVTNPNEFQLVKIAVKKDKSGKQISREVEVGSYSYYAGEEKGVNSKFKVNFKYTKMEDGIYEIYFQQDLEPGEYCFMYAGANDEYNNRNPRVYDFAIK